MEKNKEYNIGLDIGTTSVGWAVTDLENKIIKIKGKRHLWGARLFKEANTAVERRTFRGTRRRLKRRKERINLLQELLKEDVNKKDNSFFEKLNNTKIHLNDEIEYLKENKTYLRENKYNLFDELELNDKDFYNKYKTIYHLRDSLINNPEKQDIRFVYLAIHHILKYRGNFLYEGTFDINKIEDLKIKLLDVFKIISNNDKPCPDEIIDKIFEILLNTKLYKRQQLEQIKNLFVVEKEIKAKFEKVMAMAIGMKVDLSKIFNIENKKELKLSSDYDEIEIQDILGENIEAFQNIKDIYSWYVLKEILNNSNSISEGFIKKYNKYKTDLEKLKKVYLDIIQNHNEYNRMFKNPKDQKALNYYNYDLKQISLEDFYKELKKQLEKYKENVVVKDILADIENSNFLVRLNTTDNGAIPYQLQYMELEKILENQGKYYETIKENKNKILKILTFKIPYYVGPLHNDVNQPHNWSIRNEGMEHVKVLPWNFEEVINKEKSANEFIRRMTNKCTYLPKEDVMPKESLVYAEFCVLNELNNIRYNDGIELSKEEKEKIIEEIFKKTKTVKKAKLKEFLERENNKEVYRITGFQKEDEFASSLKAYIDFNKLLNPITKENFEMVEKIIEWITIFEDKDILKEKLKVYKDILSENQMKYIIDKFKYSRLV